MTDRVRMMDRGGKKHFVNVKEHIGSIYSKQKRNVRYVAHPLALERHEELRKDLMYLKEHNWETLQPIESTVICEKIGVRRPVESKQITPNDFWDFVFSGCWKGADSLRICEGRLLDAIVQTLYIAAEKNILITYKLAKFDKVQRPLKSCLKDSAIQGEILLLPVKISFTMYSVNYGKERTETELSESETESNMSIILSVSSQFLASWQNDEPNQVMQESDFNPYETKRESDIINELETLKRSEITEASLECTSVDSRLEIVETRQNAESFSTMQDSDIIQRVVDSEVCKVRNSQSDDLASKCSRNLYVPNAHNKKSTKQHPSSSKMSSRTQPSHDLDGSESTWSDTGTILSIRSISLDSLHNSINFVSHVIKRMYERPSIPVNPSQSIYSRLSLGESEKSVEVPPPIQRRPLLADPAEHIIVSDEDLDKLMDYSGIRTKQAVKRPDCASKFPRRHQKEDVDQIFNTKKIRDLEQPKLARTTKTSPQRLPRDFKPVSNLLFVKYGNQLTRCAMSRHNVLPLDDVRSHSFSQPIATYDRKTLRFNPYFSKVSNSERYTNGVKLPTMSDSQQESVGNFKTGKLKISHSITRMRNIERIKQIRRSVKPLPPKFRAAAKNLEIFINTVHLPKMRQKMRRHRRKARNMLQSEFRDEMEHCSTDSLVRETKELFKDPVPEDFLQKLVDACSLFLVRKEHATLAESWRSINSITITKKR